MGLLDQIEKTDFEKRLEKKLEDKKNTRSHEPEPPSENPTTEKKSAARFLESVPTTPPKICPTCGLPAFWELIYDGSLRCVECEPPPNKGMAKAWWTVRIRPVEPGEMIPPGFEMERFAGMVLEWIEIDPPRKF